eukprot:TRINITY_DN14286_c0_g1_i2.p1 TRINITY_DN14286_c0_g1~~TRINITY_DN14286_c0_g1_i2.p1  ORF type:complete len:623 (+),score=179.00 TRINITY_DN14286_c0_g1_i2:77-1945(+)
MGAAASAGLAAAARASTEDELHAALGEAGEEERKKLAKVLLSSGAGNSQGGNASASSPQARRIARPPTAVGKFLRFVTVNDVYKLDNYARVASAVKEFRAAGEEDDAVVVSVLAGDFLSPCTLTNLDGGVAMLQALNEVPIDYVMFGNHEFDLKTPQLQKRISEYNGVWLNSNVTFPEFVGKNGKPLPAYEILHVGQRKVAMGAFLLNDMSQFAPIEPQPVIKDPCESVMETWEKIKEAESNIAAYVPLLHLNIKEDRKVGDFIAKQKEIADITPVLLAAHDHEVYIEEAGKSLICKVGQNADNVGVIDIWWTEDGSIRRAVHMTAAEDFPADPGVQVFVDKELTMMENLLNVPICQVPDTGKKMSTARVRFEPEPMVSFLLSTVKRSMPKVEMMVLQGGNVRGGTAEYKPGNFTYGDLMTEFAFDTHLAIVELPGEVIEASIRATRMKEGTKPFFLHCDEGVVFDSDQNDAHIATVNGEAFDAKRTYVVGTYQFLLCGMGNIEPLTGYCNEKGCCPPLESCVPIKTYFMETCMREAWMQLIETELKEAAGQCSAPREQLSKVFDTIDKNQNGYLDREELESFVEKKGMLSSKLVSFLISTFDRAGDGRLSRDELSAAIPLA